MATRAQDRAQFEARRRKTQDRSLIVLLFGVLLLLPPLGAVFNIDVRIAGIPFTLLYVLMVWVGLIAAAAVLSAALCRDEERRSEVEAGLED